MSIVGARRVVGAVDDFIKTSDGTRTSINDALGTYRSQEGLSTAQLPDIATFGSFVYLGAAFSGLSPYMVVEWESSSGETSNNSREVPHSLSLYLLLLHKDLGQPSWEVMVGRALDYDAVVRTMFLRATTPGAYGYTLNNGGTSGPTRGRILRAEITNSTIVVDPEMNQDNLLMRWSLSVTAIEDYPGA
tara:strand:+ start:159 stop:725 length:567 start_codon:yes stop_codon:yes gene_type:complete